MLVKETPDIHPTKCVRHEQVKKSKVKSHELFDFFVLSAPRPLLIWRICFIFDSSTTHEVATCLAPFVNHTVKGEGRASLWNFCSVLSMAPCLLDRSVPYVAQIKTEVSDVSCTISSSRWHRSFDIIVISAPGFCVLLTDSLHMGHKYNPWFVFRTIFMSIGQRSRTHGSFVFKSQPLGCRSY